MTRVNHVNIVRYQTCWLHPLNKEEHEREQRKIQKRYGEKKKLQKSDDLENSNNDDWDPYEESKYMHSEDKADLDESFDDESKDSSSSSSQSITLGHSTIKHFVQNSEEFFTIYIMIQMELCPGRTLQEFIDE